MFSGVGEIEVHEFAGSALRVRREVLDRAGFEAILPAWHDLLGRAAEDNAYYAPRYILALLKSVEAATRVRFATVWDGNALIGALPVTLSRLPFAPLISVGQAWRSDYTYSCTPLLDAERSGLACAGLLDVLRSLHVREWSLPRLNLEGAACRALVAELDRQERPHAFVNRFTRASLSTASDYETYLHEVLGSKRRRELARNRRRLAEQGSVEHKIHLEGDGLADALGAFLRIEACGWKGQKGTALACSPEMQGFARHAFTGDPAGSICRADTLELNGAPIAVSLMVQAGRTGFAVKCCYDESFRSFSPGLLLELDVIRSVMSDKPVDRLDAGTDGPHVIDSLWPGRVEVGDLLFSLSPRLPKLRLSVLESAEHMRDRLKALVKSQLGDKLGLPCSPRSAGLQADASGS